MEAAAAAKKHYKKDNPDAVLRDQYDPVQNINDMDLGNLGHPRGDQYYEEDDSEYDPDY